MAKTESNPKKWLHVPHVEDVNLGDIESNAFQALRRSELKKVGRGIVRYHFCAIPVLMRVENRWICVDGHQRLEWLRANGFTHYRFQVWNGTTHTVEDTVRAFVVLGTFQSRISGADMLAGYAKQTSDIKKVALEAMSESVRTKIVAMEEWCGAKYLLELSTRKGHGVSPNVMSAVFALETALKVIDVKIGPGSALSRKQVIRWVIERRMQRTIVDDIYPNLKDGQLLRSVVKCIKQDVKWTRDILKSVRKKAA